MVPAGPARLGLLIYVPALGGQFVFDDLDLQETASTVRTGRLRAIIGSGRPVLMASYVLSHRFDGFQPFPFHLTNVLLHCLNAMFLWGFLIALFKTGSLDDLTFQPSVDSSSSMISICRRPPAPCAPAAFPMFLWGFLIAVQDRLA